MNSAERPHHTPAMGSDVWLTPPALLAALGPFDLDPCAAPTPRPWPTATHHIALPQNGLAAPWFGRVWLNPPYSTQAPKWVARLAEHGRGTALVFARTETEWFCSSVWRRASALYFIAGRLHFHDEDGRRAKDNAGAPSVLAAYGEADARALAAAAWRGVLAPGYLVRSWDRFERPVDPLNPGVKLRRGSTLAEFERRNVNRWSS